MLGCPRGPLAAGGPRPAVPHGTADMPIVRPPESGPIRQGDSYTRGFLCRGGTPSAIGRCRMTFRIASAKPYQSNPEPTMSSDPAALPDQPRSDRRSFLKWSTMAGRRVGIRPERRAGAGQRIPPRNCFRAGPDSAPAQPGREGLRNGMLAYMLAHEQFTPPNWFSSERWRHAPVSRSCDQRSFPALAIERGSCRRSVDHPGCPRRAGTRGVGWEPR